MRICVQGLWHLGCVTAACLSEAGHIVVGLDDDEERIAALQRGVPPIFEPGLADLLKHCMQSGRLTFTSATKQALAEIDILWVAFDTPVDDSDRADVEFVMSRVEAVFPHLQPGTVVIVSSQLPIGSVRRLADGFREVSDGSGVTFAAVPENLRLGRALDTFKHPERVVIGMDQSPDSERAKHIVESVLRPFGNNLIWMSVESAEMVKHALNAYLATNIAFINEIASACEAVGADSAEVERGLRADSRVGARAYVRAGPAFAGGTLARDVTYLIDIGGRQGLGVPLLNGVMASNRNHRLWALRRLNELLGDVRGRAIAIWGLSYKPGTDAIRQSTGIEICRRLMTSDVRVRAFDPAVKRLPEDLADRIALMPSADMALDGADAVVLATDWPEFELVEPATLVGRMAMPLVIDPYRMLAKSVGNDARVRYVTIGRPS